MIVVTFPLGSVEVQSLWWCCCCVPLWFMTQSDMCHIMCEVCWCLWLLSNLALHCIDWNWIKWPIDLCSSVAGKGKGGYSSLMGRAGCRRGDSSLKVLSCSHDLVWPEPAESFSCLCCRWILAFSWTATWRSSPGPSGTAWLSSNGGGSAPSRPAMAKQPWRSRSRTCCRCRGPARHREPLYILETTTTKRWSRKPWSAPCQPPRPPHVRTCTIRHRTVVGAHLDASMLISGFIFYCRPWHAM